MKIDIPLKNIQAHQSHCNF